MSTLDGRHRRHVVSVESMPARVCRTVGSSVLLTLGDFKNSTKVVHNIKEVSPAHVYSVINMALTSQQAAAGDSAKAASTLSGEDFGDLLHLYRSLYILSQDVDANLPRIGGPNDKYRQGQKERSLGALAVRYELQRMRKKGLRRFQGAEMLDTFRKRWKTLRKNIDFQFNDFWTHGSRACEVGEMHELRKAYGLSSSRFPNLPEYPTAMAALTDPGSEAVTDAEITLSSPTDESPVVVRPSIASKASLDHRVVSQNDQSEVAVSGSQPKDRTRNSEAAVQ